MCSRLASSLFLGVSLALAHSMRTPTRFPTETHRRHDAVCKGVGAASRGNSFTGLLKPFDFPVLEGGDVYQFGVFEGGSLRTITRVHDGARAWGFDSFAGLPPEELTETQIWQWRAGRFSTSLARVASRVSNATTLIPGFFNESLTPKLAAASGMRPATYVDIDADLYSSSRQALDWLFSQRLLVRGSVVGYDDWWALACAANSTRVEAHGEPRAHREVTQKYGARWQCICGPCVTHQPGVSWGGRTYFALLEVGASKAETGFHMSHDDRALWMRTAASCGVAGKFHILKHATGRPAAAV